MSNPLFTRTELVRIGRSLGALLVFFGGLALIWQNYFGFLLPASDGFQPTIATVIDLERLGSFQSPSFFVTLEYDVPDIQESIRSGQQVEFEQYYDLVIGQTIDIRYDPKNIDIWRMERMENTLSENGLGILMMVFGAFSLGFPTIVRLASRQDDFELKDELDDIEISGVKTN